MRRISRGHRLAATIAVFALVAVACGPDEEDAPAAPAETEDPAEAPDDVEEAPAEEPDEIATGIGVTEEPCPDAVNEDNGCIYLGILSDLTEGPFAALAVPIVAGQEAFFDRINQDGGIGGYDIDINEYTRDTFYDPQEHSSTYRQIEPNILMLAQSLGTPPTEAILPDMDADDVIAMPATWWSGWDFPDVDNNLILNSGYSYCMEAMIGIDWMDANVGEVGSVLAVGYPGDYGGDSAAGVELWAEANDAEFLGFVETAPNAIVGTQDAAIGQVVGSGADLVVLAVGPAETAEIVGGSAANDFASPFLGSVPTWNPALMQTPAGPALEALFTHISPWENFEGESEAHQAMQDALDGELPDNDGFTFGWIWSYPVKAVLEAAADQGDLTRAGLRAAVDGLVVDYEGALPDRVYGGDPNETAPRVGVIARPDADAPLGISTVETGVTGPTADAHDYSSPCVGG